MAFWRRKAAAPEKRRPARATVVEVGSSVVQSHQSATSLRLRLRVSPEGAGKTRLVHVVMDRRADQKIGVREE